MEQMLRMIATMSDGLLSSVALYGMEQIRRDLEAGNEEEFGKGVLLAQLFHAEMTWRGMDLDALDLFSRLNAIYPVDLSEVGGYSGYVEAMRQIGRPHQ